MKPMRPMEPLNFERWWPDDLGHPFSSGGQNGVRYAFFPEPRRLLIERDGRRTTYDTGDHRIGGVQSQQANGGAASLTFSSQHGPVRLDELRVADEPGSDSARGEPSRQPEAGAHEPGGRTGADARPASFDARRNETAGVAAGAPKHDAGGRERVVFSEEGAGGGTVKLVVQGEVDLDAIEALEDFIRRQKRRLGRS